MIVFVCVKNVVTKWRVTASELNVIVASGQNIP